MLKALAAPVARLFVEICRAPAKTYEDEKSVLTAVLANPLQPMPAVATAAEIDFMIAGGLARYVANFTSIGKNAPPTGWTPDFDLLIAELFKTYLPGVIDPGKTPAQNALAILANLQTLAVNMSAPVTPAVSFGAYAAQFFRKWAPELAKYRFQIAEDVASLYGGSVPLFLAPATLDIANWLPNAKFDEPPTPLAKQAELMSLISLVQPADVVSTCPLSLGPVTQLLQERSLMHDLKLMALDAEDLSILAAHLQDAVLTAGDMTFLKRRAPFRASRQPLRLARGLANPEGGPIDVDGFTRRRTGIRFECVLGAKVSGFDPSQKDTALSLLTLTFEPGNEPSGFVTLHFSGGGAVRLEVECIEAALQDLGAAWTTPAKPSHSGDDGNHL